MLQSRHIWEVEMIIFLQWHSYAFIAFALLIFCENILIALLQICRHCLPPQTYVCVHYFFFFFFYTKNQIIPIFLNIISETGIGELVFFFLEYRIRTDEMQGSFHYDFCNFGEYLCSLVYIIKVCISKSSLTSEMKLH